YTVKYGKNNVVGDGKGTVTVNFKGNYKGNPAVTKTFSILPKHFTETTITAKDLIYNAKAGKYRSTPVIKDTDGKKLTAGTDYDKAYVYEEVDEEGDVIRLLGAKDVVQANSFVRVTVTGKGKYTNESISATYRILPSGMDISKMTFKIANKEYTGRPVTITAEDITSIKLGKKLQDLQFDTDYIITGYTNNVKKGTATVTIKGIGNYGGTKTVKFKIGQRSVISHWQGIFQYFNQMFGGN
ncbi:MAG: hypothetical protein IKE36_08660, partial [Solobacterium sp.]|nr:hypothetical protein [Solobacterium sp.]